VDIRPLHQGKTGEGEGREEADYEKHVPIHPWILSREIVDFLDPSATIILDSFLCSTYLSDKIKAKFPGQILDSGEAGGHGHGIGMGIGAQLARPGKQALVLASDTAMGIAGGDIETAVRYDLPIVYVVCNAGSVTGGAHCWFQGQVDSWDMLPNVRYDKLSEVFGCHGEYVTESSEIRAAPYRAFNSGKAAVVNVPVDNRLVHPWFETLSVRLGVIVHQLDVAKIPVPFRSYLLQGRTPEVERELQKLGIPRGRTRKKVLAMDRVPCVG
jgi:thiamine pyrophosphate-dependent acetolactate synthase large subunit-like protein